MGRYLTTIEAAERLRMTAKALYERLLAGDPDVLALEPTQPFRRGKWLWPEARVEQALARGRERATGYDRRPFAKVAQGRREA